LERPAFNPATSLATAIVQLRDAALHIAMSTSQAHLTQKPNRPKILTIPRELRDEIYKWTFSDILPSSTSHQKLADRERVAYSAEDPETYYGEGANRYPKHTSLPSTHWLLHTSRQLRAEVLDSIRRMSLGKVHYRIDLAQRNDKYKLYPTWITVPLFTDRVDVLEVTFRIRDEKTASIVSAHGDEWDEDGDVLMAGLMLLRRFIERGVYLLSKKKTQNVTVAELLIQASTPPTWATTYPERVVALLESWICGESGPNMEGRNDWHGTDELLRFLAEKVERVRICLNGKTTIHWVMKDLMKRRDRNMGTIHEQE
jgi:hypothetical protein